MSQPNDIVIIEGPTVPVFQASAASISLGREIIYSIQLTNGGIVTSPSGFPDDIEVEPS